jgi:hypothetical protein
MMEFKKLIAMIWTLAMMGVPFGCSPPAPTSPAATTPGLNLIIAAEGEVLLKRDGWSGFHPTSFGAVVHRGDQLQPAADAEVVVLCENLTTWTVPGGLPSGLNNGCPQVPEPALVSAGGLIANTRGGTDPLIPYIISPRSTKLLDPMPTLRWNAAPGAKTYTLRISGIDWQEQVEATEFKYPGNPALQPGTDYLLIVEANNGKFSKDEGLPGLGFSLLAQEEADRVRADVARIDALNLSADATAFALAQLFSGHQLYAEAIELLENSAATNDRATNVYRALGDLYQHVGLLMQAEARYLRAVEIAEAVGDIESGTAAKAKLGEVYLALGNKTEAREWLTQAQAGYESLGDSQRASEIAEQLQELGNK